MTDPAPDTTDSTTNDEDIGSEEIGSEDIGYVDALGELEDILGELEDDNVNIDVLSERVERAAELIRICRGRILRAEEQVAAIVEDFDPGSDTDATE